MQFTNVHQINGSTPEGKLLLQAINMLQQRVFTSAHANYVLGELYKHEEGSCLKEEMKVKSSDVRHLHPFEQALEKAIEERARNKRATESDLKVAACIIMEKAAASLPPDQYSALEKHLVDLLLIYTK